MNASRAGLKSNAAATKQNIFAALFSSPLHKQNKYFNSKTYLFIHKYIHIKNLFEYTIINEKY